MNSNLIKIAVIFLYIICYTFQVIFLIVEKQKKFLLSLYLKGLCSLVFVCLGIFSSRFSSEVFFNKCILIGLCFDASADVIFNLRFAFEKIKNLSFFGGAVLFFTGHVFYLVALFPNVNNLLTYLIIFAVIDILILIFFGITLKIKLSYKIFGVFYISQVSLMETMSLGFLNSHFVFGRLIFSIGALFFLLSDILLIYNTFHTKKIYPIRVISFITYYTGQLLIATSLFWI